MQVLDYNDQHINRVMRFLFLSRWWRRFEGTCRRRESRDSAIRRRHGMHYAVKMNYFTNFVKWTHNEKGVTVYPSACHISETTKRISVKLTTQFQHENLLIEIWFHCNHSNT